MPTDFLSVAFVCVCVCVCVCFVSLCAHIWDVSPSQECVCVRQRGGGRGGGLPLQTCRAVVFPGEVQGPALVCFGSCPRISLGCRFYIGLFAKRQAPGVRGQAEAGKEQKVQLSGEVKASGQRWGLSGCGLWLVSPGSLGLNGTPLGSMGPSRNRTATPNLKSHLKYANT